MAPRASSRSVVPPAERDGPVVITGGAGFVGSNLADRLLAAGRDVVVLDAFARPGVEANARWLLARHGSRLRIRRGDVRDPSAVTDALRGAAAVFHFAAQVAVTASLDDPRADFDVNAGGTLHVLDELRLRSDPPPLVFTSTNKVYGALLDVPLRPQGERYEPENEAVRDRGVDERTRLDFRTPYGCSKGAADQLVLEYARAFGLPSLVFRMSCIYGPRQVGTEDQGWVAHLALCALQGRPITVYGDGRQVRDLLYVSDLVDAFLLAWSDAARLRARAFNIGGGPSNAVSLLGLLRRFAEWVDRPIEVRFADWRPGDQRYYVSDTAAFRSETGWTPRVRVADGVERLRDALLEQTAVAEAAAAVAPASAFHAGPPLATGPSAAPRSGVAPGAAP